MRLKPKTYSDVALVKGVFEHDSVIEQACYDHCRRYFDQNWRGLFFVGDEHKEEIFQESFITFWQNIENRKIYVEDNTLKGKNGKDFTGSLTTYFMSISRLKYLEWTRQNKLHDDVDGNERYLYGQTDELYTDILYDAEDSSMMDIIADCISRMSAGCSQIMTLFYYQEKTLDDIMIEVPSYKSKDALKTAKYKCMNNVKKCANTTYEKYIKNNF